jgi:hypothetical protein
MALPKSISNIPPLTLAEKTYNLSELRIPLERLSKADPSNVQEIVASQIELMAVYHNVVIDQARKSFTWALIAAGVGLAFFIGSVSFTLIWQAQNAAWISLISGALIEFISAINFYLYSKTSLQLADFQSRLDTTQRYLLANSICEGLDKNMKQLTRSGLVGVIAGGSMGNYELIGKNVNPKVEEK